MSPFFYEPDWHDTLTLFFLNAFLRFLEILSLTKCCESLTCSPLIPGDGLSLVSSLCCLLGCWLPSWVHRSLYSLKILSFFQACPPEYFLNWLYAACSFCVCLCLSLSHTHTHTHKYTHTHINIHTHRDIYQQPFILNVYRMDKNNFLFLFEFVKLTLKFLRTGQQRALRTLMLMLFFEKWFYSTINLIIHWFASRHAFLGFFFF